MLYTSESLWTRMRETVNNFRVAVLLTIGFLAFLMAAVAIAAVVFDVNDRGMAIIGVVLAALPTLVTSLIVYLKVDNVEVKADVAARRATVAARRAEVVEGKIDTVQEFVVNGGLRSNVVAAIHEAESTPEIQEQRVELTARGVQADRHSIASREANAYARGVLDAEKRHQAAREAESQEQAGS
jgi:hypothetical protein